MLDLVEFGFSEPMHFIGHDAELRRDDGHGRSAAGLPPVGYWQVQR